MEKSDEQKEVGKVTSLFEKELSEHSDDSEHSILEPVNTCSKENESIAPEFESTKSELLLSAESTIPKIKPRFSVLQEFDPLCVINKETKEDHPVPDGNVIQFGSGTESLSRCNLEANLLGKDNDDYRDANSIPAGKIADEPETIYISESNTSSSEELTAPSNETVEQSFSSPSEEIINEVTYEKPDESLSIIEKSDIYYPTFEHPDDHIKAESSQFLDTVSTIADDTFQCPIRLAAIRSISSMTDAETRRIMSDLTEKMDQQQQELSELKLQLNAVKQAKASLELELTQKDEVILKTQAELIKIEQSHKHELKQLKEKLKENSKLIQKEGSKDLQEELKECKAREAKAIAELALKSNANLTYERSLDDCEKQLTKLLADHTKEVEGHEITKRHLASLELAFSDVHSKYERSKELIQGYMKNEEDLVSKLDMALATNAKHEEKYESLKAHAKNQIDKSNLEILSLKERDDSEINKLRAIIKRLEIKCTSLEVSLQQKSEECEQLAALCDEVTGQKV